MDPKKLDCSKRKILLDFLWKHPELYELCEWKMRLHAFYRIKGYHRAALAMRKMIDEMAYSELKEIKILRRTLMKWKEEILNYFLTRLINGRVEGFNNKAKLSKKDGLHGYRKLEQLQTATPKCLCLNYFFEDLPLSEKNQNPKKWCLRGD